MARSVHISTARQMLNSGDPIDISAWKVNGSIMYLTNAVSLRYNCYVECRNVKLLSSDEMRRIRDVSIFSINGLELIL
ncbi:MAG: hypothetical protein LIP09_16650 [Bacteroidales bacterium]|nr:hypothetical protein [Bacteroidales bacterium]